MVSIRQRLVYFLRRIGKPGMAGLLMLSATLGLAAFNTYPLIEQRDKLDVDISSSMEQLSLCVTGELELTPAQKLSSFYGNFTKSEGVANELGRLFNTAASHHLTLDVGEYSYAQSQTGNLDQFRITLPIKGQYPAIRAFAWEVLEAIPSLSLESINLRREKISENIVDGRIVFLLFVEHGA